MSSPNLPEHIQKPHIRRIQPIPGKDPQGRPIVQLRDPFMLAMNKMLAIPLPAMQAVQRFDGEHDLQQIADAVKLQLQSEMESELLR